MRSAICVLALTWTVLGLTRCVAPARAQPALAPASDTDKGTQRLITMDFQDVDVAVVVKFISEITGKNFILDERVHGKVTIISPTKMSIAEAYQAFQSALELKGFTTVAAGAMIKIVPTKQAKSSPIDTVVPQQ
jgi:general secretion pathway protein D